MEFKTQYNADSFPDRGELNDQPSLTVPDMALSISELIRRQVKRVDDGFGKEYDEEEPDDTFYAVPDFNKMDLAEKEEFARQAREEVDRLKAIMNEKARLKKEADQKAAIQKQREEWEASQNDDVDTRPKPRKAAVKPPKASGGEPDESTNTP